MLKLISEAPVMGYSPPQSSTVMKIAGSDVVAGLLQLVPSVDPAVQ